MSRYSPALIFLLGANAAMVVNSLLAGRFFWTAGFVVLSLFILLFCRRAP